MASASPVAIAFIGFGEVGQTFSRGLMAAGNVRISAYDVLFGTPKSARIEAAAASLGVSSYRSLAAALTGASIIFSSVTASAAEAVAEAASGAIEQGQLFVDVNSAAPATKQRAAALIEAAGGRYLEAAVMAPVLKPGLAVPILAGGPHAREEAARLNRLGMKITAVSDVFGRASAMKLCRSIIIKGLEALMVDCAEASRRAGVSAEVFTSLGETFPSIDWPALAENMQERVATHGIRRSAEMREAGEMLDGLGLDPSLALAVAAAQARGARSSTNFAAGT
jgi:3-hydroxyisobutyrate dehydrogenase-like beta-hydroxyacid dehydrogenase